MLTRAPLTDADAAAHREYQRIYERFRARYAAAVPSATRPELDANPG